MRFPQEEPLLPEELHSAMEEASREVENLADLIAVLSLCPAGLSWDDSQRADELH